MAQNVEIKARIPADHFQQLRKMASSLSADSSTILIQEDTFFSTPHQRLKLREFDDGTAELIAYSRSNQTGPKLSSYIRSPIADPDSFKESLARTIGIRGVVKKRRELFLVGQTRIHLDHVEQLGEFLELEVVLADDDTHDKGVVIATELREKLGVPSDWLISCAYIDLLDSPEFLAS